MIVIRGMHFIALSVCAALSVGCATPTPAPTSPGAGSSPASPQSAGGDLEGPGRVPAGRTELRLAVLIVVDQLRAGLFERVASRLPPGGARRFLEQGIVYRQTRYAHAITETAVGHATLATGALPREHGIVANEWYDLAAGGRVYAVDDDTTRLVGAEGEGKSPSKLLVPTVGDALFAASDGAALIRAISEKDRGAVLPAGLRGRAFWLDDSSGRFATSSFYAAPWPPWLGEPALSAARFRGRAWDLYADPASYAAPDDAPWELGPSPLGNRFPHPLTVASIRDYVRALKHTPFADQLVADGAVRMIMEEGLGQDGVADLLVVSLSSTDYIGHSYGPESREAEDNLLVLDRTLASLIERVEERVGREHVVFVLSADHGIQESPEWFVARGQPAGRIDPQALLRAVNDALKTRFPTALDLVVDFVNPYLWIDETRVQGAGLALANVEDAVLEIARTQPGIHTAYLRRELLAGRAPQDELSERVARSIHPVRSGHVYLVPKQRWLLATTIRGLAAMHGTPWEDDIHVPMMWLVPGAAPALIERPADPRSVAASLARLLGVTLPSASGAVLPEVLGP